MDIPERLKQIKEVSKLSWRELAVSLGYANASKTQDIASGKREMRGPSSVAFRYFSQGFNSPEIPKFIKDGAWIIHTKNPRFIAKQDDFEGYIVKQWIDEPLGRNVQDYLNL